MMSPTAPEGDDRGATAVEYGLLVALVAAAIVLAVAFFGAQVNQKFTSTGSCVSSVSNCP